MKRMTRRNRVIFAVIGLVVLLLLAVGGFLLVRHNQAAHRQAQAATVFKQLKQDQATLQTKITKSWTDDQQAYLQADVTPTTVTALQRDADQLTTTAKPYAEATDKATAAKYTAFTQAQAKLTKQIKTLRTAQTATAAVNALFQSPVLTGATTHTDVIVQDEVTTATVTKAAAKARAVNATLNVALLKATTLAKAQITEREALKKQVAVIADDGTLKSGVTLAQLTAFKTYVAKLKYAGLKAAYQTLLTAVDKKAAELDNLKALSASDRQKRVLLAYAKASGYDRSRLDQVRAFFVDHDQISGTTYTADIGTLNFSGEALSANFKCTLTATLSGAYTLTRDGNKIASGNLMKDFTAADTAKLTRDAAKIVAPKLTVDQFKQAITSDFAAEGLAVDLLEFPEPATVHGNVIELQIMLGDGAKLRYDASTGEGAWYHYAVAEGEVEGYRYDAKLTTAIWAQAAGN
ncbi:hypothetical protein [Lacticaseibacillus absianus]|uniref:hypothetical protein n=1 Tax=Lacticaseibacillus absianus TaxID=2729623 RepID=UPI0015CC9CD2|nr:hypothetical protein [Lacticaseibacillus absianus]